MTLSDTSKLEIQIRLQQTAESSYPTNTLLKDTHQRTHLNSISMVRILPLYVTVSTDRRISMKSMIP